MLEDLPLPKVVGAEDIREEELFVTEDERFNPGGAEDIRAVQLFVTEDVRLKECCIDIDCIEVGRCGI